MRDALASNGAAQLTPRQREQLQVPQRQFFTFICFFEPKSNNENPCYRTFVDHPAVLWREPRPRHASIELASHQDCSWYQ